MAAFPFLIHATLASDGALRSLETGRHPSSLCLSGGGENTSFSGMDDSYSPSPSNLISGGPGELHRPVFRGCSPTTGVSVNFHHRDSASDGQLFSVSSIDRMFANLQRSFNAIPSEVRYPVSKLDLWSHLFEIYPLEDNAAPFASFIGVRGSDEGPRYPISAYLNSLARALLDFSALTTLVVMKAKPEGWDEDAWAYLGRAPNLRAVLFHKSPLVDFLEALALDGVGTKHSSRATLALPPPALFPALSIIRLVSIDITADDLDSEGPTWVTLIIRALEKRVERGQIPIARLQLDRVSYFYHSDLLRIQEAVPSCDVVWDECVLEESPSGWNDDDYEVGNEDNDWDN